MDVAETLTACGVVLVLAINTEAGPTCDAISVHA
jgi:hypothetical protein